MAQSGACRLTEQAIALATRLGTFTNFYAALGLASSSLSKRSRFPEKNFFTHVPSIVMRDCWGVLGAQGLFSFSLDLFSHSYRELRTFVAAGAAETVLVWGTSFSRSLIKKSLFSLKQDESRFSPANFDEPSYGLSCFIS